MENKEKRTMIRGFCYKEGIDASFRMLWEDVCVRLEIKGENNNKATLCFYTKKEFEHFMSEILSKYDALVDRFTMKKDENEKG